MDLAGKPSISFRYNPKDEELEELNDFSEDEKQPSHTQSVETCTSSDNISPKKVEKTPSLIDKYFKSIKSDKSVEKVDDSNESKVEEKTKSPVKEVTASPVKEYLNRFSKKVKSDNPVSDLGETSNETWRLFHDWKFKITQAVDDIKSKSVDDAKDKVTGENNASDSEDNSAAKDVDQHSTGDTDNQVSSLGSSMQNLSDLTSPCNVITKQNPETTVDRDSPESDDTHKNFDTELLLEDIFSDPNIEIESGVEALEALEDTNVANASSPEQPPAPNKTSHEPDVKKTPIKTCPTGPSDKEPSNHALKKPEIYKPNPRQYLNFYLYFLTFLLFLSFVLFRDYSTWNGFLLGMWSLYTISTAKDWFMDNYLGEWEPERRSFYQIEKTAATPFMYTIPTIKEQNPLKRYEGWVNQYRRQTYDPFTYSLYKTTTAFMKLEGSNLRISYTKTYVPKRHLWDEKLEPVTFYQHRMYSLVGGKVLLLPEGLVKRRHWSKKYPIGIILHERSKVIVLEREVISKVAHSPDKNIQVETESIETSSPEKKKKFVWRKKEKSASHSDGETVGKEGLRHRIVRKMHREKKPELQQYPTEPDVVDRPPTPPPASPPSPTGSPPLSEEPPFLDAEDNKSNSSISKEEITDDELDEREMARIKEFIEEVEAETIVNSDGIEYEWTVHIKSSKEKQNLFILARTGRDKHEWYRRLYGAILETRQATEVESSVEKSGERIQDEKDERDSPDIASYKAKEEKTNLTFAKSNVSKESKTDGTSLISSNPPEIADNPETAFWPYIYKIMKGRDTPSECGCRVVPGEMAWVNVVLGRVIYDVMTNPTIHRRLHTKVQKKLNTLKLPSFMSPLVVEELSISGACPLIERISPPMADERGVWLEADMRYEGGAYISLLTQINLLKLKDKNITLEDRILESESRGIHSGLIEKKLISANDITDFFLRTHKPAIYDSDAEDSAESSGAEDTPPVQPVDSADDLPTTQVASIPDAVEPSPSSKNKFLKMVDKLATNKYFQQVTDYKYVKRAMEGLSNTDIKVHVTIEVLEGRLVINLPPPPHDRVWLGFRENPQLILKARPAFGARSLRFAHISNWIEEKLTKEFEKAVVMPNMEDLVIDSMTPTPVEYE